MKAPHQTGWAVRQILASMKKGNISLEYPIQRPSGVWKPLQQSYLIHSLMAGFPIPPLYHLKAEGTDAEGEVKDIRYVLDGKQRLSTIQSFVDEQWALDDYTPPVTLELTDSTYEVAGRKFSELDEELQFAILSRTISNFTFDSNDTTDEEVEDLFFRMNSGSVLSAQQKAKGKMGVKWATRLNELGEHIFFKELASFSPTQIKSDAHLTAILQTMMMMDRYDYKNVSQRVIADYQMTFKEDEENKLELFNKVVAAIDYLMEVFNKKDTFMLKKVNLPMTLLTTLEAIEKDVEPDLFTKWVEVFKEDVKATEDADVNFPTNYKEYTGKGTTDRVKADGRMNEMKRHLNEFLK